MTFKRFGPHDVILNTLVTKPEISFLVHSGTVYYQYERSQEGNYSNKIKHIPSGHLSLHEMNVDRPSGSLVYPFIEKASTRYAWKSISTSTFDDNFQFLYGDTLKDSYPDSASLGRIYIPSGVEFSSSIGDNHENKKYISALKNPINFQDSLGSKISYGSLGTDEVNMLTIPGIFYGSSIEKGSIELEYFITGSRIGKVVDKFKDGRLYQVSGTAEHNNTQVGVAIYNYGILILTASHNLHSSVQEKYFSTGSATAYPKWTNFATGAPQFGEILDHGTCVSSSYTINFKGINKIPNLTMYAYSKLGKDNYSSNPTFTKVASDLQTTITPNHFSEPRVENQQVNRSEYADQEDDYESTVYISKIGIYDKYKNLIAIATLANPVKKTEKRDFMFKLGIDF